jgi:uncharacterized RDD family membrane protein YckC
MAGESAYVGFWVRVGASLIDTILVLAITVPLLWALFGSAIPVRANPDWMETAANIVISYVGPAVGVIMFWIARQATPGKMAFGAKVVDADSGKPLTVSQAIVRYLGYFVSTIPLCLGLIWVGIDSRKQGWHDKLAGTVVVRQKSGKKPELVKFDNP